MDDLYQRQYYSMRVGTNPKANLDLDMLRELFFSVYSMFEVNAYFQEAFGYACVDTPGGWLPGSTGSNPEAYVFRKLRKSHLWPIADKYKEYSEEDIFDTIELLYDLISKPVDGYYHDYCNCGWHYNLFDKVPAQAELRYEVNDFLRDYKEGYEISANGEIQIKGNSGLNYLLDADIPNYDAKNVDKRIHLAIAKYRRRQSSAQERRDAVRDLADIFEFLRPRLKEVLRTEDENALFNIANNFGIRHHNSKQKSDYNPVWLSWIFYIYLATIHMAIRLLSECPA
ncbi:MAG TPA: hypothetical protein VGK02_09825 [Candidatus Aquicultor sp.]|jgi:hypothetical protein